VDLARTATELISNHPAVRHVELAGSRSRGTHAELSDWDFAVTTSDFAAVARDLPALIAPLHRLGQQWEPLGHFPVYQVLLPGPTKVEYVFLDHSQQAIPAPKPGPATLDAINTHFWDWIWWIATKAAIGRIDLVAEHLPQLFGRLLEPIGVPSHPPTSTRQSISSSADATSSSATTASPYREHSRRKCAQASTASAWRHSRPSHVQFASHRASPQRDGANLSAQSRARAASGTTSCASEPPPGDHSSRRKHQCECGGVSGLSVAKRANRAWLPDAAAVSGRRGQSRALARAA